MTTSNLIGTSPKLRAVLNDIQTVAPAGCAVLIYGETGTGKELVAQAIHAASPRRQHKFVPLNCAAIPAALLESELFGHERGAFTGAVAQRMGRFQAADRGTLFLDEIGELPIELQPKLLRALQEQKFERLGSSQTTRVDVRIVAATNRNLEAMVAERRFRMDLYYRLNVYPIYLPPLRERKQDIPLLAEHFVHEVAKRQGKVITHIPNEVMEVWECHNWPGNIRELQNVIERAVVMTTGSVLSLDATAYLPPPAPVTMSVKTLADAERAHITATLRRTNWVVGGRNGAAAQLGLPRTTLLARMQRLGIANGMSQGPATESSRPFARVIEGLSSRLSDDSAAGLRAMEAVAS